MSATIEREAVAIGSSIVACGSRPAATGDAVLFAVHHRPVRGTRGVYRVNLRHGVSRLRSGHRQTLGVIFHDAS